MADYCIHVANLFYLASFLGRDMLWLRVLTCFGLSFGIVFFTTCQSAPMYGPTFWHVAFLMINFYQIHHLFKERQRLRLSNEQEAMSREMLESLSDEELVNSLAHAMHVDGDRLELVTKETDWTPSPDELALRDIAFNRLSRTELINLLTRRVWQSLKRVKPKKWRRSNKSGRRKMASSSTTG